MPSGFKSDGSFSGVVFKRHNVPWRKGKSKLDFPQLSKSGRKPVRLRVEKSCEICGRKFIAYASQGYCSRLCYWEARRRGVYVPWNKGLTVNTDFRVRRLAEKMRGRKRPTRWRMTLCKNCNTVFPLRRPKLGKFCSQNCYGQYRSRTYRGSRAPHYGKKRDVVTRSKISASLQRLWLEQPERMKKALISRRPNNDESRLSYLFVEHNLPYRFVGDGSFVIGGKNPDFVNVRNRKIIELFGERWHPPQDEADRIAYFRRFGYDTLVVWRKHLAEPVALLERIKSFDNH